MFFCQYFIEMFYNLRHLVGPFLNSKNRTFSVYKYLILRKVLSEKKRDQKRPRNLRWLSYPEP